MRAKFSLSQSMLAHELECSVDCIRRWEQGVQRIPPGKYVLLDMFESRDGDV